MASELSDKLLAEILELDAEMTVTMHIPVSYTHLVHLADSKEQLDSDTETLYSTARKHLCQLSTLRWQQKDGLDTVLPLSLIHIYII